MKFIVSILALCLCASVAKAQSFSPQDPAWNGATYQAPAGGGGCTTEWLNVTNYTPFDFIGFPASQKIPASQNTTGGTVCKITQLVNSTSSGVIHAEVWTGVNRTGTQLGGNSDSVTVTGSTSQFYTFAWSSNYPVISSGIDFYYTLVLESGVASCRVINTTGTPYQSTAFDGSLPTPAYKAFGAMSFIIYKQ